MKFNTNEYLERRINIMTRKFIILTASVIISFQFCGMSSAQSYRDLGSISLNETFEKMLEYSKKNDFDKLEKSFQLIKPLSQFLENKYSKNTEKAIQSAIDRKDGEKAFQAIQQLIFLDMKDLLLIGIDIVHDSKEKATTKFKYAYLDYLLLSPYIQVKSYSGDQKIRNLFRKFAMSINKFDELKLLNEEIEKEIINSFPTLKSI